ncbi:hypothetical protein [Herbaspirillum rubrisubalbicans]|uniref:hypothetical protein n=1 Tax=Herbaspirillum rubrisubalbicans TaxID=80842 RepID=UPI0012FE45EA|nr:hypothetical protein [Herbaspirillum rubrisubalbicans]
MPINLIVSVSSADKLRFVKDAGASQWGVGGKKEEFAKNFHFGNALCLHDISESSWDKLKGKRFVGLHFFLNAA